jgi:AraC-like DNA-binding protein
VVRGESVSGAKSVHEAGECILALLALRAVWRGRRADLVEPRRQIRILFVSATSVLLLVVATTEFATPSRLPEFVTDLNVLGLFAIGVGLAMSVVGIREPEVFEQTAEAKASASSRQSAAVTCTDFAEAQLMAALERLMAEDRAHRESGLTIGGLAARLGVAEHALRRLINRRLGWRNFNAYLNSWRIAEARDALLDRAQAEVPISTIALDAGFQSLGPFNRAFKSAEGVTPTEFRQNAPRAAPAGAPDARSASRI